MKKINKKYIVAYIICLFFAFIQYFIFRQEINNIFIVEGTFKHIMFIIYKVIALFISSFIFFLAYYLFINRKKYKIFIKYFFTYFSIMLILLFLCWPGIFKGDEYYTLESILKLDIVWMQSLYTSLFYIIALCIIPTIASITFLQILIISIIVGYIMANIEKNLNNKKLTYLLYIALLLPPVIDNNLFTLRSSLISYIFLLLIFHLIFYIKDKQKKRLIYCSLLSCILANWKMEFMYLPVFVLFYIVIELRRKLNFKKVIIIILCFLITYGALGGFYPNKTPKGYLIIATVNPLSMLSQYEGIEDTVSTQDIKNIEKFTTFDNMKKLAVCHNVDGGNGGNYALGGKALTSYLFSYFKLVMKNPIKFIKVRAKTFLATNMATANDRANHTGAEKISAQWDLILGKIDLNKMFKGTESIFGINFKKKVISTILMRNIDDYTPNYLNNLFYNIIPQVTLGIIFMLYYILKKKSFKAFILFTEIFQIAIIFVSAPASFWMYYMPLYLLLNFTLIYFVIEYIDNKNKM